MPREGSSPARVLIVDDLKGVRQVLRSVLAKAAYEVLEAEDGRRGLDLIRTESPDVVLLDLKMPGLDGMAVLEQAVAGDPELPIVMITAYADTDTAVQAMQRGAYHYLSKPFHHAEVLATVERAVERRRLTREVRALHDQLARVAPLADQLGTSDAIQRLLEQADRVAPTGHAVLITGEDGTGTEAVARAVHGRSGRRAGPFIPVDCGAVPAELLEAELFGHERDAFPGAGRLRPGQLELAAGGTLCLADVGALPLAVQARLIGFLHDGEFQRVGGEERIRLDVRLVATTAADLRESVAGHLFRRDLYERLAEAHLAIPPLRERPDDIVGLIKRLLDATSRELHKDVGGLSREALDLLVAHSWPGNVRELRHVLKRAVLLADGRIEPAHLAIAPAAAPAAAPSPDDEAGLSLAERKRRAVERLERQAIADALQESGGNKRQAAKALTVDYKTLLNKIKKYEL